MSKTQCLLLAVAAAAMAFTVSCSSGGSLEGEGGLGGVSSSSGGGGSSPSGGGGYTGSYGSVADDAGQAYKTVVIGTQTWMAENLNYNAEGSVCYDNDPANCAKYGRLYDWATAKTACPSGWHLPNREEWETLSSYVQSNSGCSDCDARLLKATSGWDYGGNGTDDYGFSALPGGYGIFLSSNGSFSTVGGRGFWWSASESENNSIDAWSRFMYYDDEYVDWENYNKSFLRSVRCLQD